MRLSYLVRSLSHRLLCSLTLAFAVSLVAEAQVPQAAEPLEHSSSGLKVAQAGFSLQVDALRPDLLRVRLAPVGRPAEDASWAVVPASRMARVPVTSEPEGFSTSSLRVRILPGHILQIMDLAGHVLQQDALPVSHKGSAFTVSKLRTPDDHFFGLGDKPGPLDRTGEAFTMWNTDNFGWQESTDPIYKSIPFFLEMHEGRTIGVLFDNTFRTFFDFGRANPDRYTFSAPDGPLDYYILTGPEPRAVVQAYAWLTGPTPLPPAWALGFQQSRYTYYPRARVEEIATRLRADRIPSDVLWLDIDYQYKNRPFTVDPVGFPEFPGLLKDLSAQHFHTVLITDLHIAHLPNQSYAPYDSGEAGDHFVKRAGAEFVGPVWPGPAVFPEFTQANTRQWWGSLYKEFMADGAAGFWNDMNEPAVFTYPTKTMPDDVQHRIDGSAAEGFSKRTATHLEIHNVYGMENSRATTEGQLAIAPNRRPFTMTRATYAGGQRYATTWTGDNSSTWNHLRQTTPQLLNLGLSGFALAGADVGGFAGSPSADLLTRWLILSSFQPIDRDHAAKGTADHEPWVDGPAAEAIRRRFIEERYKLMPYLYTVTEETSRTGLPIIRPLFLEFPHATADSHPLDNDAPGEFLFGPSLLIADAPFPESPAPYEVHLPPGLWYSYWTGEKLDRRAPIAARDLEIHEASDTAAVASVPLKPITITPALDKLPIYVHAGTILPLQPLVQSTDETPAGPLTLRIYPPAATGDACEGQLYMDDGKSFDFRTGNLFRLKSTCALNPDGTLTVILSTPEGTFKPWFKEIRIEAVGYDAQTNPYTAGPETHRLAAAK